MNVRPLSVIETYHKGGQPQKQSFLTLESSHIQIVAVKESEEKDGVIVRAVEMNKQPGKAVLKAAFMDRQEELDFAPCEIKTVKLPYDHSLPVTEVNLLEL